MKKFAVSSACNACGECMVRTPLLIEDDQGFAVVASEGFIPEDAVNEAEKLAATCPMCAITIIEQNSVSYSDPAALEQLADILKNRLSNVEIPEARSFDLQYRPKNYDVPHGYADGERCFNSKWTSTEKAERAGRDKFDTFYWNRRKEYAHNILAQYRSDKLLKFFDFKNQEYTIYTKINEQMGCILKEITAESNSIAGSEITFPSDFTTFSPHMNRYFREDSSIKCIENFGCGNHYVNTFFEGFDREEYHSQSYYHGLIGSDSSDYPIKETEWSATYAHCYEDVNETGEELIRDIKDSLEFGTEYGLAYLEDMAEDQVSAVLSTYREYLEEEIEKKITIYKQAISGISTVYAPSPDYVECKYSPTANTNKNELSSSSGSLSSALSAVNTSKNECSSIYSPVTSAAISALFKFR